MAVTLAGAASVGTDGPVATVKAVGHARIQFDSTGTYVALGVPDFQAFVRTLIPGCTLISAKMALPGGLFDLYYDATNDSLRAFVVTTGVEVAPGAALTLVNAEMDIVFQ